MACQCTCSHASRSGAPIETYFEVPRERGWETERKSANPVASTCVIPQEDLRVGDIILSLGRDTKLFPLSKGIKRATKSVFSHSALYIGRGEVIEATIADKKSGLLRRSVTQSIANDVYALVFRKRVPLTTGEQLRLRSIACSVRNEQQRDPKRHTFDIVGLFVQGGARIGDRTLDKFYCSEYILYVYEKAGVQFLADGRGSPGDLGGAMVYTGHLKFPKEDNRSLASGAIPRCSVRGPDDASAFGGSACGSGQGEVDAADESAAFGDELVDEWKEDEASEHTGGGRERSAFEGYFELPPNADPLPLGNLQLQAAPTDAIDSSRFVASATRSGCNAEVANLLARRFQSALAKLEAARGKLSAPDRDVKRVLKNNFLSDGKPVLGRFRANVEAAVTAARGVLDGTTGLECVPTPACCVGGEPACIVKGAGPTRARICILQFRAGSMAATAGPSRATSSTEDVTAAQVQIILHEIFHLSGFETDPMHGVMLSSMDCAKKADASDLRNLAKGKMDLLKVIDLNVRAVWCLAAVK